MSISDRYRSLAEDIHAFVQTVSKQIDDASPAEVQQALKAVQKGMQAIDDLREGVGEIPRIRLEDELTPVLMRGHNHIDRGRLDFLEAGDEKHAAVAWELQQKIYRLLNDL